MKLYGKFPFEWVLLGMSLKVFLNLGRTHEYGNLHRCMGMQEHIEKEDLPLA
jgi:hypothetical protein